MKRPAPEFHRMAWASAPWRNKWVWRWACPLPASDHDRGPGASRASGVVRTKAQAASDYARHYKAAHPPARKPKAGEYPRLEPRPGTTLAEAKMWLRTHLEEGGAKCPCCTQVAKVYRRSMHASMTAQLVRFYEHFGLDWGQRPKFTRGRAEGDFAKLRYWGLIEESDATREDGGRAGWWRVTEAGAAFIAGAKVRQYALVFDGRRLRLDGPLVGIEDALGRKFDLNTLMGRAI